jgi:hypothetical protein
MMAYFDISGKLRSLVQTIFEYKENLIKTGILKLTLLLEK